MQLEELRVVAKQRGWTIEAEFVDDGVSGVRDSRPGLDAMLEAGKAGEFDLLAVWRLDRLGRSLQHLLHVLDDLRNWGVGFVSLRDAGIDTTTASGRLMLQLLGAFAEFEREMIRERVVAGVLRAQAAGKHCGRPRVAVSDEKLLAAQQLLDDGWSWRRVSRTVGVPKDTLRRRLAEASHNPS